MSEGHSAARPPRDGGLHEPEITVLPPGQWEYMVWPVAFLRDFLVSQMESLDEMGSEGWEVVTVLGQAAEPDKVSLLLKRPVVAVRNCPKCGHQINALSDECKYCPGVEGMRELRKRNKI